MYDYYVSNARNLNEEWGKSWKSKNQKPPMRSKNSKIHRKQWEKREKHKKNTRKTMEIPIKIVKRPFQTILKTIIYKYMIVCQGNFTFFYFLMNNPAFFPYIYIYLSK